MLTFILEIIAATTWVICFSLFIASVYYSQRFFKQKQKRNKTAEGISILKPCKSVDAGFYENLISFFQLKYEKFEILFSVADPNDPAVNLIRDVIRKYPQVDAQLILGASLVGKNPKVNNLVRPLKTAKYDIILISDSNIRVPKTYLQNMIAHLKEGVGIVCSPVAGFKGRGVGGSLEEVMMNTGVLRWLLILSELGRAIPLGKSMLLRKSTLESIGGLKTLGSYIAEDFIAGFSVRQLGLKVVTSHQPIYQFIGEHQFSDFWKRHLRWGRIRKSQTPFLFLIEALGTCFPLGLIGAFGIGGEFWFEFFLAHIVIWFSLDFYIAQKISGRRGWRFILPWILRESLALPHWLHAAARNSIQWRDQKLVLKRGGLIDTTN